MQSRSIIVCRVLRLQISIRAFLLAILTLAFCSFTANAQSIISPGATWDATNGSLITAHGGQILKVGSTYYWIGEVDSSGGGFAGINCYSSTNLTSWAFVADVLPPQSSGDLESSDLVERPKVLYNSSTGKYVMWMHIWNGDAVGYATSTSVCGTYTYLGSSQPLGNESFDIGSFQDTNGNAYLLSANYDNGIIVYLMNSAYTAPASIVDGVSTWGDYEAPAMFKAGSYYFLLMSHQTGWSSNDDVYSYAPSISGPWSTPVDFSVSGTETFNSQSTYVLPVTGSSGTTYMYMGDRWNSSDITDSTYIWLPLTVSGTSVSMDNWYQRWTLNVSAGTWAATDTSFETGHPMQVINDATGYCLDVDGASKTEGADLDAWTCNSGSNQEWTMSTEGSGYYMTSLLDGQVADDSGNSKTSGGQIIQWDANGGTNQQWTFTSNGGGAYTIQNVYSGLCLEPASTTDGALVEQINCSSSTSQLWKLVD
jgi:hypothetical protein